MLLKGHRAVTLPVGLIALTLLLVLTPAAKAVFTQTWQAGIANGSNSEFAPENGSSNAPPGNPATTDDDWYFAGKYPAPIGFLAATSANNTFERALTNGDPTDRIHFNLAPDQLDDDFKLDVNIVSSNFTGGNGSGNIPIHFLFNGVEVFSEAMTTNGLRTTPIFNGKDVGAISGDNIITLTRDAGGSWTQFDYIRLSNEPAGVPFTQLWQLGIADGNANEFVVENGNSNAPPGDPATRDDDWYFAGTYPAPIGALPADSPLNTFERALVIADPVDRIHFNLTPDQLNDNFFLDLNVSGGSFGAGIPFAIDFNGVEIFAEQTLTGPTTLTTYVFSGLDVGAVTGDNVITLRRPASGGAYMLFDYVRLNVQDVPVPEPTTVGLALMALAGLGLRTRRQRGVTECYI